MKIQKTCLICNKEFKVYPSDIKSGKRKFCSIKCYGKWQSQNIKGTKHSQWKGGKIKKVCLVCKKEYFIFASENKSKFCSKKCYWQWNSLNVRGINHPHWKKIQKRCQTCDKELWVIPSSTKMGRGKFCSVKCSRGPKKKRRCLVCDKEFWVAPSVIKYGKGKFCSRKCSGINSVLLQKKKNTSIEIAVERELIRRGIKFQKQYPIRRARTVPDFFIPPNICIYCDGDFWHNLPKNKQKDFNQNFWLKFLGYKVYRFWEKDIKKSVKKCINKLK